MTRISKTSLLLGVAVLALTACGGSKGPGALGTKDDIVVRNNGLPGATAPVPPSAEGELAQVEAAPTPEVAGAPLEMPGESQPLPNTDPAVEQAVQQVEEARAPIAPTTTTPMSDATTASTAPATASVPADVVAPEPVAQAAAVEPPPAEPTASGPVNTVQAGTSVDNTYVPSDAPASAVSALNARRMGEQTAAPTPAPVSTSAPVASEPPVVQAPVEVPVGESVAPQAPAGATSPVYPAADYPAQAPVQTQVQAQAQVQPAPAPAAPTPAINFADPQVVKTVQAALKIKGVYKGKEDGVVNTQYLNALSKYQGDNKLPQGGLNIETLRHLGAVQ